MSLLLFGSLMRFFAFLEQSQGRRALLLALISGALAALAFPPFNAFPVLWVSFPAALALIGAAPTRKRAFLLGWTFAFGYLVPCLYWISASLFVDIKSFWWALPFAVAGLPAFLAVFYAAALTGAYAYGVRSLRGALFFALCWFAADLARSHLLTGFPWDVLGYVWADYLAPLQSVSLIGIEGLGLLTALIAVIPAALFYARRPRVAFGFSGTLLAVLLGLTLWGAHRAEMSVPFEPNVRLRLVQPGLDQSMKWRTDRRAANFQTLLDLTFAQPGEQPITHYLWPETATAYYLGEESGARERIAELMPKGTLLLTGAVRRQADEPNGWLYYNSLIAMNARAAIVAGYDKTHLVPFGEYMPLRSVLPFRVITALGTDFTSGAGVLTLRVPGLPPLSPLVCYEAIFSGEVVEREDSPGLLLNVTNDAWYEGTIGPIQHFAITKVRAVEEGLPLIRVANKGITAVVTPLGKVLARTGPSDASYIDSNLPQPWPGGTFFGSHGGLFAWLMAAGLMLLLLILRLVPVQNAKK